MGTVKRATATAAVADLLESMRKPRDDADRRSRFAA
jgi:soluble cytochrome b562